MRIKAILALLAMGLMFFALAGCNDNNENENNQTVRGTIVDVNNLGVPGATVQLLQNGNVISTTTTANNGTFQFNNVRQGTFQIRVTGPNTVTTFFGGFNVTNQTPNLTITALGTNQLPAGVTPTPTTASVVAFGTTSAGVQVPVIVTVGTNTPSAEGNPVILNNVAPGTVSVTVLNPATNQAVTFQNVQLLANNTTIFRAQFPPTQTFSVGGTVSDINGVSTPNASVSLLSANGTEIGNPVTTSNTGAFTFQNVAPGTFSFVTTSANGVRTITGPVLVTNQNVIRNITAPANNQLPTGVTTPTNNTATLIAYVTNTNGQLVAATVQVNQFTPVTGTAGNPVVIQNIAPGTYPVRVTVGTVTQTFQNVTLNNNTITALNVPLNI